VLTEATGPNPGCYQEKENIICPLFFIICPLFLKKINIFLSFICPLSLLFFVLYFVVFTPPHT